MHYINWCLQENKHLNMEYDKKKKKSLADYGSAH
jgi:hypothetical protein